MPTIPFVHKESVAVYVAPDVVHLLVMRAFRGHVETVVSGSEPIVGENDEAVREALTRLADRHDLAGRVAVMAFSSRFARFLVVELPDMHDDVETQRWCESELRRHFELDSVSDDLIFRSTPLEGEPRRALVACARKTVVERFTSYLRSAELVPAGIFLEASIGGAGYMPDDDFVRGEAWHLGQNGVAVLSQYHDGRLRDVIEVPTARPDLEMILVEIRARRSDRAPGARLYVAGDAPASTGSQDSESLEIRVGSHDAECLRAAGLTAIFDGVERIDFLVEAARKAALEQHDRREAFRLFKPLGLSLLAVLLVLFIAEGYLASALGEIRLHEALQRPVAESIAAEHSQITDLQQIKKRYEAAMASRTSLAGVLEHVGRSLPDDLRATALTIDLDDTGDEQWRLRMVGETSEYAAVTSLLARLEADPAVLRSLLRYARDARGDRELTSFEVEYVAAPMFYASVDRESGGSMTGAR
jgi:hypothetical protein